MSELSHESPGHTSHISYRHGWPNLEPWQTGALIAVNVGSLIAAYVLLRIWWKPPTQQELL